MRPRRRTFAAGAARRASAVFVLGLCGGCVTTYEQAPPGGNVPAPAALMVPVTIPFAAGAADDAAGRLFVALFHGLLARMQAAAVDRDVAQLDSLIASCDRPDLPPAMAEQVQGFRAVSRGLHFLDHVRRQARLVVLGADAEVPPLGQPIHLEVRLPAPPAPVVLGGRADGDAIGFAVSIVVDDTFYDGGSRSARTQDFLWLPERCELRGERVLTLPIDIDLAAGAAVERAVFVRIDLMPGYVDCDGVRAPVQRTAFAATSLTQRPAGAEAIRQAPLTELEKALRGFTSPADFTRAWLAARSTQGADRVQAMRLLIEQVRFGRPDQSQVAMAALRSIADVDLAVGDRDAWLAWWGNRRP